MKRLILLLLLAAAGAAAVAAVPAERWPELAEWLRARGLGGALLVALLYVAATVLLLPASWLTLVVGAVYGPWFGYALVAPASLVGATLAFLLGRGALRPAVEQRWGGGARFRALQRAVDREGARILVLVRLSPVFPFNLSNYAFGLTRLPLGVYVLGSFLGMLPGTWLYVFLGSTAGDLAQLGAGAPDAGAAGTVWKAVGLLATLAATVLIARAAKRALAEAAPEVVEERASGAEPATSADAPPPAVSVVVPVLDEAEGVAACIGALRALPGDWELVVVDGGSADGTVAAARAAGADRVLSAPRGRGPQLAAGAAGASREVLLFLHADCRLPQDAAARIAAVLTDPGASAGAFAVRHACSESAGPLVRRLVRLADRRSRSSSLPYGDQALFLRRERLEQAGGVPPLPLFEDLELSRRLRRLGPVRLVPAEVRASARRFEQRPWRTFFAWMAFPLLFRLGVPAERLAAWYGRPR
jgi:rSAM/selenodomain-associated transferase 2